MRATTDTEVFFTRGWFKLSHDPVLAAWVERVRPLANDLLEDPALRAAWLRCGGTWFAGVNVLENDPTGAVPMKGVPPLGGEAVQFVAEALGLTRIDWDPAQVSICLPGYPRPWDQESEAAFRYRLKRDAAHVDGVLPRGPDRRRHLGEAHAFVLGIPLNDTPPDAAPLVVWEGSHEVMRQAFLTRLEGVDPRDWSEEDVTDAYTAARRKVFEICPRVPVHARPGEAYVVHRLALHGVAPWTAEAGPPRSIAYFRPDSGSGADQSWWLLDR